jgi:tRNA nucleotidyltransferase (CCA-adding enzyme)
MHLILCHTTADFDTLGAAVGYARLQPRSRIVLTGGCHPPVRQFLALHRDEYPLLEQRSVNPDRIQSLTIVDTQMRERLGKAQSWLDLPQIKEICLIDHHVGAERDIPTTASPQIEAVGATTTLVVETLQQQNVSINAIDATVMALGIHVDTGSLTFAHTTIRDAAALTWLMAQGANLAVVAQYLEPGLSPALQALLPIALEQLQTQTEQGYQISWVVLQTAGFVPGLSSLANHLMDLTECDALLLGAEYCRGEACEIEGAMAPVLTVIGRSRIPETNLNTLFKPLGGGGHAKAATTTLKAVETRTIFKSLLEQFQAQIPHPPTAQDLMSSPVRTIRPETTIAEAQRVLLRYGHSGLSVVDDHDRLVGIISRRDLDIALHHGFSHAPVKGYMTTNLKTITPDTILPDIEALMVTYDIGRLPVLADQDLVGIVTRTDVLRHLHSFRAELPARGSRGTLVAQSSHRPPPRIGLHTLTPEILNAYLTPPLWELLQTVAEAATQQGWQLYLVGGAVRDILIQHLQGNVRLPAKQIEDIDLVVDGCHRNLHQSIGGDSSETTTTGAGVLLARGIQQRYPQVRLQVHGRFQTAALLWHQDPTFGSLWIDIATARTEFYPYPAANPEVEASSLQQDLYRRDFTINALAVKLTPPHQGTLLDFFGGSLDLVDRQVRVLHANSFIEDPTRIYRAVRFAVRLGFEIEPQTERYIRYAIASGIYDRVRTELNRAPALQTRLKAELKYILQAPYWQSALQKLSDLDALKCIHPALELDDQIWKQLRLMERCLSRSPLPLLEPDLKPLVDPWLIRLELLMAAIPEDDRHQIAVNFQLPDDSQQRLQALATVETQLASLASPDQVSLTPSQRVEQLESYTLPLLLLIAVRAHRPLRRQIWQYVTEWSLVTSPLDGNDLKRLGYRPGPQFKPMLIALRSAALDGKISNPEAAYQFLMEHYPLKNSSKASGAA